MRRLILLLSALAVAACGTSGSSGQPGGSGGPVGTVVPPSVEITPEQTVEPVDISSWVTVAPVGQGFGVAFPGQPSTRSITLAELQAPTALYTYSDPSGRTYQLARSRVPRSIISSDKVASLGRFALAMLKPTLEGSSIVADRKTTFYNRPAIRYTLASSDKRAEGLLVLDDEILYRVSVSYDTTLLNRSFLEAFLGSFTLSVM